MPPSIEYLILVPPEANIVIVPLFRPQVAFVVITESITAVSSSTGLASKLNSVNKLISNSRLNVFIKNLNSGYYLKEVSRQLQKC